ncbi:hypothetical protein [Natrialba asiatica]|uniref:Domain of unknown function domain-containing protein n=1 Tax=Natrialba asiatica (strain ATCC 700177 / DSM 12278 / JCM 9576 / FERM P-10747 / NBRC 102637 / 172P1) TaxID=29540 RepID=M0AXY0_NATA1|nr:hypothetical protein [Natrialba asiatica]ELZ03365.1 hypothetical protein C481_05200 [Natrialba asiatica DSM 12278]
MNTDIDRDRGVLSPADRAYLLGEREMSHDQSKRNAEARIRRRIRAAVLDFDLFLHTLAEKDRRQVFEGVATDGALRDGLRAMLAFAYLGLEESGATFETVLEPAVRSSEEYLAAESGERVSVDVSFDIETTVESSLAGVVSRLEAGEPVTPRELFTVVMQGDHDPTSHDRIVVADADGRDGSGGLLERLAGYLEGDLRYVTDSRAVVDLETADESADRAAGEGSADGRNGDEHVAGDTEATPPEE